MPIYAYRCSHCQHAQDVLRKISDAPLTTCTVCYQETFVKQVTSAGFALKGTGWYVTDFKEGGAKKDNVPSLTPSATTTSTTASPITAAPLATAPTTVLPAAA